MADEIVGDLSVQITGDYSELQNAIDQAAQVAGSGASAINDAFNLSGANASIDQIISSFSDLTAKDQALQDAFQQSLSVFNDIQTAFNAGEASANTLNLAMAQLQTAAQNAGVSLDTLGETAPKASDGMADLGTQMLKVIGISLTLEGAMGAIGSAVVDAVAAFSQLQTATIALTAMTGSATGAAEQIENLRAQANNDALSFPSLLEAAQRMTAFGLSASQTTQILQLSADAAAATGNNFDTVSQSLGRLVEQGTAGARQLTQLGITQQQLAAVMGVSASQVAAAFKAMDPSDRLAIASQALQKFAGDATLMASTVTGQWNLLKNATNDLFTQIGSVVGPATAELTKLATYIVNGWAMEVKDGLSSVAQYIIEVENAWADLTGKPPNTAGLTAALASMKQSAKDAADALNVAANSTQIFYTSMGAGIKTLQDSREELAVLAQDVDTANKLYQSGQGSLDNYNITVAAYGAALDKASTNGANFADTLLGVQTAQSKANVLFNEATSTLQQATPGTTEYARAIQNVGAAWDAANPGGVKFADTLMGIGQAVSQQNSTYISLLSTLDRWTSGITMGTTAASQYLAVTSKLASAAAAMHQPFADAAADQANVYYESAQAAVSLQAAADAAKAVNDAYAAGDASAQDVINAFNAAAAAADKAGTSYQNAQAQYLKLGQGATNAQAAFEGSIAVLGKFGSALTLSATQSVAWTNAVKLMETAGDALGIKVTQIAGNQNAFTISTTNATPAVQKLAAQMQLLFAQNGQTATVISNTGTAITGVGKAAVDAAQQVPTFTIATNDLGVAVQHATSNIVDMGADLSHLVTIAKDTAPSLLLVQDAVSKVVTSTNNQVTSARSAFDAWTQLNSQTQKTISGQLAVQDAFQSAKGALAQMGIQLTATGATTTSTNTAVQNLVKQLNDAIAAMNNTQGPAANAANAIAAIGAAAASAGSALQSVGEKLGDVIDKQTSLTGYGNSSLTTSAAPGSQISTGGGFGGGFFTTESIPLAGTAPGAGTGPTTSMLVDGVQTWVQLNSLLAASTDQATQSLKGFYPTLQAYQAAVAAAKDAQVANTSAVVAATTATTAAWGNLINGIQSVTTATTALQDANSDLGTNFTDVGSAIAAVETLIGESSGSLKQQFENLVSELNSTNTSLSSYPNVLYSATAATGAATSALQTLTGSTAGATSTLVESLAGLTSTANAGTITWDQYNQQAQALTDEVNAGTLSTQNASSALAQLAQEALNAGQSITAATGGLVAVAGVVSSVDPSVLQKALADYTAGQGSYYSGFSTAGQGASNIDAANQQATFAALKSLGDAFTSTTGLTLPNGGAATAQVDPNLTYDPQSGQYTYAVSLPISQYAAARGVTGNTATGSGSTAQQAEIAAGLAQFGIGGPNTSGGGLSVAPTQGPNYAAYAPATPTAPTYSTGNPLPVTVTNTQPPAINITVQAGVVAGTNGMNQLADAVQQRLITALRQAGVKL